LSGIFCLVIKRYFYHKIFIPNEKDQPYTFVAVYPNHMKKLFLFTLLFILTIHSLFAQRKQGTGVIVDTAEYNRQIIRTDTTVPQAIYTPLRQFVSFKAYTPFPKDQGDCETCVGWACAYGDLTTMWAIENGITDRRKITDNAFDPLYLYYGVAKTCKDGADITKAMYFIRNNGVPLVKEINGPVNGPVKVPASTLRRISYFQKPFDLNSDGVNTIQATKFSLSASRPVVIVGMVDNNFYNLKKPNVTWVPLKGKASREAHALLVIGYDDSKQRFEIMNSWGPGWGNDGYFYISYDDYAYMVRYAYSMVPNPGYEGGEAYLDEVAGNFEIDKKGRIDKDFIEVKPVISANKYIVSRGIKAGDIYKLSVFNVKDNTYHYIIGMGADKKAYVLYPKIAGRAMMAAIDSAQDNIGVIPISATGSQLAKVGTYKYCVLFSGKQVAIDSIVKQINQEKSVHDFDCLADILGQQLIPRNSINYKNGYLDWDIVKHGGYIVPAFFSITVTK